MIGAFGLKTFALSHYSFKTEPNVTKKDGYTLLYSSDSSDKAGGVWKSEMKKNSEYRPV